MKRNPAMALVVPWLVLGAMLAFSTIPVFYDAVVNRGHTIPKESIVIGVTLIVGGAATCVSMFLSSKIAVSKGYNGELWFLLGFLGGVVTLVAVWLIPVAPGKMREGDSR